MKSKITTFRDKYFFLSNFYPSPIQIHGKTYPTVEHYYQASKCKSESAHEKIRLTKTGADAKRLGRFIVCREDWDKVKLKIMVEALLIKFENSELESKLINTAGFIIEEQNYWHDNFWGNCTCNNCSQIVGQNYLGKFLMKIRSLILNKHLIEGPED